MWSLIEYQGKVAVALPWSPGETPVETRDLWVSPTDKWDGDYYGQFTQVRLIENGFFRCYSSRTGRDHPLNTSAWIHQLESRPIKPPGRGGKVWNWRWSPWSKKYIKEWK
jgi:hypothetical protein